MMEKHTIVGQRQNGPVTVRKLQKVNVVKQKKQSKKSNKTDWVISQDYMTWWSAQRFCQAVNRPTIPSLGDLACRAPSQVGYDGHFMCYDANTTDSSMSPKAQALIDTYPTTFHGCEVYQIALSGDMKGYAFAYPKFFFSSWDEDSSGYYAICK